jgi:acetolactate synthase-1/2/3 large subunit
LLKSHDKVGLYIGGRALRRRGLEAAARIKALAGCEILTDCLPGYMDRGGGLAEVVRIPYFPEPAIGLLSIFEAFVIAGTSEPVSVFGYEGLPGRLMAPHQARVIIAGNRHDPAEALEQLADVLGPAGKVVPGKLAAHPRPLPAQGRLSAEKVCQTLAALQPEGAIIVDEGVSSAFPYYSLSRGSPAHSLLTTAGCSIGYGMPCATGAAVACPDRQVINFEGDGSAAQTAQSLWTQARQRLNVVTLICANRGYNILKVELERAQITSPGPNLKALLDLDDPTIDWVKLAGAMGVPGVRAETGEALEHELRAALAGGGPRLIEMVIE